MWTNYLGKRAGRRADATAIALFATISTLGACASDLDAAAQETEPELAQVAGPGQATQVVVQPARVKPAQSFTVTWTPNAVSSGVTHRVQLRERTSGGFSVLWESPEITGSLVTYSGPPIQPPGNYEIVVIAREGPFEWTSAPAALEVIGTQQPTTPPVSGTLPSWARPLLGQYTARTDAFSMSPIGPMLSEHQIALSEFVEVPGGLELRTKLCVKESTGLGLTVYLRTPEAYPEIRQRVVLAQNGWSTQAAPLSVGYDRDGYPGCDGRRGQRIPKRPEQTWIRGTTCVCNALSDEPTFDDCRVTDPDRDGNPGIAFKYRGAAPDVETWVAHTASVSRWRYVSGTIDPGGSHYGAIKNDEASFLIACEPGTCGIPNISRPCTSNYNGTQFHRLSAPPPGMASWTCESLRQNLESLFTGPRPPTPNSCTRDQATQAP
jgi:hypothetical protein